GPGLDALDDRHGHDVLGDLGVDVEDAEHLFDGFVVAGVRGVAFLPEELGGAKEHAGAQLPAEDVGPLVDQYREIAPALNRAGKEVANDGFGGWAYDVGLFELLAARDGDYSELGGEAFDVLGLLAQETLRDEQGKVGVLVPGGLEAVVEFALDALPNGVSVGL